MNFTDDKEDFFDREIEKPVQVEKTPDFEPDDPRYWEEPESEFEHLKPLDPRKRSMWWMWMSGVALILAVIISVYLYWFQPYSDESITFGYVENIERRGTFFKTYEGVILPYKELMDTTRVYKQDFLFTALPDAAVMLRKMQFANKPVRVTYKRYHATLPWRGDSKVIVIEVDSVDPSSILPPEYRPDIQN